MGKRITNVDPRAVERAALSVPGVAFAEVVSEAGRPVLRVVLWQDAPAEETSGLVELALRDELGVEILGGDVRMAGFASREGASASPGSAVRVIDLGENTWATETISGPGLQDLPPLEEAARSSMPALISISVGRTAERCHARVEVDGTVGARAGEAYGPATDARMRRVVCEAAAQATALACGIATPDVEDARIDTSGEPAAIVVVATSGDRPERRAGAALAGGDPWHAFAQATVQAVAALTR